MNTSYTTLTEPGSDFLSHTIPSAAAAACNQAIQLSGHQLSPQHDDGTLISTSNSMACRRRHAFCKQLLCASLDTHCHLHFVHAVPSLFLPAMSHKHTRSAEVAQHKPGKPCIIQPNGHKKLHRTPIPSTRSRSPASSSTSRRLNHHAPRKRMIHAL
jgi:hypothetical protein